MRLVKKDRTDPLELETFVGAVAPRLMATARMLTMNHHDAEDLVQETLTKVVAHWERVARSGAPLAYARTVLVNTFISGRRRRSASEVVSQDLVTSQWTGTSTMELSVRFGPLWPLLTGLPPRQRAVLVLRYFDDLPDDEIALVVGCSVGNVRVIAHRGLAALRPAVVPVAASAASAASTPTPDGRGAACTPGPNNPAPRRSR